MQKGDIVGLVIVSAMLIGIGLFFWFAKDAPEVVYAPKEITGSKLTGTVKPDGSGALISAEVKEPGFVGVHQAMGDAPGPIIGFSPLLAVGSYTDISIETTEPLLAPNEYIILMFVDDGDGVYESRIDLPVMSDGQVVKQKLSL